MKILLIVHSVIWKGGGAFFHALHIAKGLNNLGHDVEIMCTSEKNIFKIEKKKIDGVNVTQFPDLLKGQARNGWDFYNTLIRIFYILKNKYDIIHLLDTRPVVIFPGLVGKYFRNTKLVIEWLDWFGRGGTASERRKSVRFFMEPVETFFEEKFRKYADASVGLGEPLAERARSFAPNKPIVTITHGCDTESIKVVSKEEAREKLDLPKDAFLIGYTGRMREDVIIRLVKLIKEFVFNEKQKNIFIVLIGNSAIDVESYLDDKVKKFFIRTGWIDYNLVNLYMSASDVLILPFNSKSIARNGIWPSKVNDYLAVGRPIVSTELDVLRKLFENKIGFMVKDEIKEVVKACKLLMGNKELALQMGENARKLAEEEYNWKNVVTQINNFYKSLL